MTAIKGPIEKVPPRSERFCGTTAPWSPRERADGPI
jgi:hypothetical protein